MIMKAKTITISAVFTAITIIFAQLVIPLSHVPVSMSIIAVFLAGALLEKKYAVLVQLIYIALGVIGVPVFSNFSGGLGKLIGPTGGYILAYPIMAYVIAWILEKNQKKTFICYILSMLAALFICYTIGTIWLAFVTKMGLYKAIFTGVIQFIAIDFIKVLLSAMLAETINKRLPKLL